MTQTEALRLALEALKEDRAWLETDAPTEVWEKNNEAITTIKAALEAKDEPHKWKLVPIEPTDEMLKAMDECSIEGYDERLYAGYAASVYMAAVDVAPSPSQQHAEDIAKLGWQYFECPACGSEGARAFPKQEVKDEPVAHSVVAGALFDFMGWLTSREKRLILSSVDEASPAVEAITEFAKKRNLSLKYAEVGYWMEFLSTPPQQEAKDEPVALAWAEGYRMGIADERTSEANIGIAGFNVKVEPARENPYVTTPPQRTWVGLTDEEANQLWESTDSDWELMKRTEAKLKEKNT